MEEKTYFEDNHAKVTSFRVTYKKDFIPVDMVEKVFVRLKVTNLVFAFVGFLLSLIASIFLGQFALLIVAFFFIWLYWSYSTYVELWISEKDKGGAKKMLQGSIGNSMYIYQIEDAINVAMKRNQELRQGGNFQYTDTMRFRQKLKEYE